MFIYDLEVPDPEFDSALADLSEMTGLEDKGEICAFAVCLLRVLMEEHACRIAKVDGRWELVWDA